MHLPSTELSSFDSVVTVVVPSWKVDLELSRLSLFTPCKSHGQFFSKNHLRYILKS